jgi:hypothetical protein
MPPIGSLRPAAAPAVPRASRKNPAPAIFANYARSELPLIIDAARRVPPKNPAVIGTYGINKEDADAIHKLPNGKYAPVFVLVRKKAPSLFEGIPELKDCKTWKEGFDAGKEIGLRMRDRIEAAKAQGVQIDSWQLDELWPSLGDNDDPTRDQIGREYIRGAIEGISRGRNDELMQGYVYVAKFNKLAERGNEGEIKRMWATMDRACLGILGEEYPPFRGDPATAAERHAHGVDLVRGYGEHGANVAAKYIPLLTPGFRGAPSLGGRQPGQTVAQAEAWQDKYTDLRTAQGAAGIGFFGMVRSKAGAIADADLQVIKNLAEDVRRTLLTINRRP